MKEKKPKSEILQRDPDVTIPGATQIDWLISHPGNAKILGQRIEELYTIYSLSSRAISRILRVDEVWVMQVLRQVRKKHKKHGGRNPLDTLKPGLPRKDSVQRGVRQEKMTR